MQQTADPQPCPTELPLKGAPGSSLQNTPYSGDHAAERRAAGVPGRTRPQLVVRRRPDQRAQRGHEVAQRGRGRATGPSLRFTGARAHPRLARLPAERDGIEHLHAVARARVGARRPRRDGVLPGAAPRAVRPRRRHGRAAAHRPGAARVRPRPLRGSRGPAAAGPRAGRARARTSRRTLRRCANTCRQTSSSRTTCCSALRWERPRAHASRSRHTAPSSSTRCAATPSCLRGGGSR